MGGRKLLYGAILIGALAAVAITLMTSKTVNEIRQAVQKSDLGPESAVDLSLKGIELLQGEHGEQLWRLKAKGAWYDQKEGVIQVSHPEIIYILKPDDQELTVRSGRGVVDQQSRIARLWEQVEIEREGGYIRCDRLIYNGTSHTLHMEGEVRFDGPDLFGTANGVVWYLKDNIINADNGVSVEMTVRQQMEDILEGERKDESQ